MWVMNYPTCSACCVDLETDGDGWECPNCRSSWPWDASDGDQGELFPDWSGEESSGPVLTDDQAADVAHYRERLDRHRRYGEKYPTLYPEPSVPVGLPEGLVL